MTKIYVIIIQSICATVPCILSFLTHFEAYEDYVILSTLLLLPLSRNTSNKLAQNSSNIVTSEAAGFRVLALLMSRITFKYEDVVI